MYYGTMVTTCCYRLLQVTTYYYRLLKITTGYYRLLYVTRGYFSLIPWSVYQGCSFEEYLVIWVPGYINVLYTVL